MAAVLAIIWLIACSLLAGEILKRLFPAPLWLNRILGAWLSIVLLGLTANIFTAWFKLSDVSIIASFIIAALELLVWLFVLRQLPSISDRSGAIDLPASRNMRLMLWLAFIASAAAGFYAPLTAGSSGPIASPWQILPLWQLLPIMVCSAAILAAVFLRERLGVVLAAIAILSFLIHSYLLVYHNGFGADRFRHLAAEERLLSGSEFQPNLISSDLWVRRLGPLTVPAALIDPAKLSYGFQWSLEAIAAKISGGSVFQINRILLPTLWSLFLPLLAYVISRLIWDDRRTALLAAFTSNSFYLLQYYGSQGLPASYGLLVFAMAAALWLAWLKMRQARLLVFCLFVSVLSYFNYSLSFILIVVFGTLAESLRFKKVAAAISALIAVAALLVIDGALQSKLAFSWTRVYDAWRDGNILFYDAGARLLPWIGRSYLLIDLAVGSVVVAFVCWLLIKMWRSSDKAENLLAVYFAVLIAGYVASWVFIGGDHLLSRRLTLFAALPLVLILSRGLALLASGWQKQSAIAAAAIIFTAYAYCSGPVLAINVTATDLVRAQQIMPAAIAEPNACVKEKIEVILALEYLTAKEFQETINDRNCRSIDYK